MSVRALAEIVIDIAVPGGATVFKVLCLVRDLVSEVRDGRTTCVELHGRLELMFEELQTIERHGGLQSRAVDRFVKTLEEYWRHLEAYKAMNIVERLIHHPKLRKAIETINKNVDELVQMIGLVTARVIVDWRQQYEHDMREQHDRLIEIATSAAKVRDEIRDNREKADAVVLLKNAIQKGESGKFKLADDTQAAAKRALTTIMYDARELEDVTLPEWFIGENDVDFDEVPFAHGSFATVHRGHLNEYTPVAVKMLLPGKGGLDATLQTAFENEVNVWRTLRHPNVARLLGACHVASRPFLVCDIATNGNMAEFLDKSPSRQIMWRLLFEAAKGIAYMHSKSYVHSDLRLANILVTEAKTALITDFGLSRVKDKDKSKSKSMTARKDGESPVEGTWRWMAPESFANRPQFESDVYSLAMCIIEAFTGEPPYADVRSEDDVRKKILNGDLPSRPSGMSDRVWALIKGMAAKERKERTPIADVVRFLGEYAGSEAAPPVRLEETVVVAAETDATPSDLASLLEQLQRGEVSAAKQLSTLSNTPETGQQLLSPRNIHRLLTALQDSTSTQLKDHVARTLANLASLPNGATLIGSRGGVVPLVELLASQHESLRRSGLSALVPLLKDPLNACMFCQARGVEALQTQLTGASSGEALTQLSEILASASGALAENVASNESILRFCLDRVQNGTTDQQRAAAARVLRELAKKNGAAVRAIDQLEGFKALAKSQNNDILVSAIKTMLRKVYGDAAVATQPDEEPLEDGGNQHFV